MTESPCIHVCVIILDFVYFTFSTQQHSYASLMFTVLNKISGAYSPCRYNVRVAILTTSLLVRQLA